MKETELIGQDDPKALIEIPVLKEQKLVRRIVKKRGHTLFELDLTTGLINPAEYESVNIVYNANTNIKAGTTSKVIIRENCYYECALNMKNVKKRLIKLMSK